MTVMPPEGVITWSHSLKLEETAKGLRISVHVYAMDKEEVIKQAFETYLDAKLKAEENKIPLAPLDDKK
jgi:hypothetical protein